MNESMFEVADRLKQAKDRKKELEAEEKENNALIEELNRELSDQMTEAQVPNFSRNGAVFYLRNDIYASPRDGDREALFAALRANGYGDLVTETVNARTLNAFAREQMEASEGELPEWLDRVVSAYEKTTVGVRKEK